MPIDAVTIVEQMCQRWSKGYDELLGAFRDNFAEGCEYIVQQDTPVLVGAEQAVAAIEGFHLGFGVETIDVDMLKIDQVDNRVWTERVDHMVNAQGERFLAIPILGVMTFNDAGKLTHWNDYWDMRALLALAPAPAEEG